MNQIRFAFFAILLAACFAPAAASAEYTMFWKKSVASGSFADEAMKTTSDGAMFTQKGVFEADMPPVAYPNN